MKFETFLFLLVSSLAIMFLLWGLEAQPLVLVPVLLASKLWGGRSRDGDNGNSRGRMGM